MTKKRKRIGFTTSLPVEVILAAGHIPVDLNNYFINNQPLALIAEAEKDGFPRSVCSWIKGIYAAARKANLDELIGVTQGDCSNTHSLMSMLKDQGVAVSGFAFPINREYNTLQNEITLFEERFETDHSEVIKTKQRLDLIREKLIQLDELTWKHNLVTGAENHYWLVSASDFGGNPDMFEEKLDNFISEAASRNPYKPKLRLGYLGVPPIFSNLYEVVCSLEAEVVFNEIQRQFAMLTQNTDIVTQYLDYTYPYSVFERLEDIKTEVQKRNVVALISYNQAFCHRQIDNILLRKYLQIPFLTLEGDQPGEIDSRTLLRLESFVEVHS